MEGNEIALDDSEKKKARIYTGTGDRGRTSLFSGERVLKNFERVEAYGDVDELNSILGILAGVLPEEISELSEEIQQFQSDQAPSVRRRPARVSTRRTIPCAR